MAFSLLWLFSSCKKEGLDTSIKQSDIIVEPAPEALYGFYKDIIISSPEGHQGTMRVYSDDESGLNNYDSRNFKLIEVFNGETLQDALVRNNIMDLTEGENEEELEDDDMILEEEFKSDYAFQLIKSPVSSNGSFAVSFFHPINDNPRDPWQYFTHYSAAAQNLEQTVDITRHSFWRRVYYGLRYKVYSTSNWSTIQNEWKKIKNNQTISHTKNPCYQYRARIKTKNSNAYSKNASVYSINFSY